MRFVVMGAGAIGGVLGGRLAEHGHDVVLVARGRIATRSRPTACSSARPTTRCGCPSRSPTTRRPTLGPTTSCCSRSRARTRRAALDALADGPPDLAVVCLQNGVDNERQALRRTPALRRAGDAARHAPRARRRRGVVGARQRDPRCRRLPHGVDDVAEAISPRSRPRRSARSRTRVMRFKWAKLLMNLGNALEAAVGPIGRRQRPHAAARAEGEAVLAAAGVDCASTEEDAARRGDLLSLRPIDGGAEAAGRRGRAWPAAPEHRGRPAQRRDRAARSPPRRPHPGQRAAAAHAHELARTGAAPGSLTEDDLVAAR